MSSGGGGPGVVERASKEISRRIHSLGFSKAGSLAKRARSQDRSSVPAESSEGGREASVSSPDAKAAAADKLNGNESATSTGGATGDVTVGGASGGGGGGGGGGGVSAASSVSKMGTIIKGSVMDKVTHVFNSSSSSSSSMGNANNKEGGGGQQKSSKSGSSATAAASTSTAAPEGAGGPNNGINIPKGAVANGRAKFEAASSSPAPAAASSGGGGSGSNEGSKPLRFFSSSRSRTNSPLLPVKTPKVPLEKAAAAAAAAASKEATPPAAPAPVASAASPTSPAAPPSTPATTTAATTVSPSVTSPTVSSSSSSMKMTSPSAASVTTTEGGESKKGAATTPSSLPSANSSTTKKDSSSSSSSSALQSLPAAAGAGAPSSSLATSKFFPKLKPYSSWEETWQDAAFLRRFFWLFSAQERFALAGVCERWREVVFQPCFWAELRPVLHCRTLRQWTDNEPGMKEMKQNYFESLKQRGFDSAVLLNANDADVFDFIQNFPHGAKHLCSLILRCCNLSDRGLEALMEFLQGLYQLEIAGCNEITEQGLWSSLHPRLVSVTINDCINVADECICAVTQLLPSLYEFNLQAYHVTDSALSYFSPKQTGTLNVLRLQSCWEITNHGIVNIVHTLPNLTMLSLSGCSKVTDDGIELIAENLRKLRSLDVSWCPRVTDAALEYIACDLNHLEELTLDRCVHITDIGIGYISTMLALHTLYLRWCTQVRDFGLQHICGMRNMQVLSLAGNPLLTSSGLSNLIQLRHLVELELTNCPGASTELVEYLRQNLPGTLVLD